MEQRFYTIKTTSGDEKKYSHEVMIDICRQYLTQQGKNADIESCEKEIKDFVSRFKLIDNNEESNKE